MKDITIRKQRTYGWEDAFRAWSNAIAQCGHLPDPLFAELRIKMPPALQQRDPAFIWPATTQIAATHIDLQTHFNEAPLSIGKIDELAMGNAMHRTIRLLWEHNNDMEKTAAVLIMAFLAPYTTSLRGDYPKRLWPTRRETMELLHQATNQIGVSHITDIYHNRATSTLPHVNYDMRHAVPIEETFIINRLHMAAMLGRHHANLLRTHRPARIIFTEDGDPNILALIEKQKKEEAEEIRQAQQKKNIQMAKEKHKEGCPLHAQWPSITKGRLETLVWQMPTTKIAGIYGVSDVAIAKKCRQMHIKKPGRGYWAKEAARSKPYTKGATD